MEIPASIYVALGAVAASIVAGFFSFLNLVSSKENKVSEFRQGWIDGLREEISTYTASLQALIRFRSIESDYEDETKWFEQTKDIYNGVVESLTKIQLRLNPIHAKENPESHEAKLLSKINYAREQLNAGNFQEAADHSHEIREVAAPLLKNEWERVKNGEKRYQAIRDDAQRTIRYGIIFLGLLAIFALVSSFIGGAS